ncbi:alpha-amylase domain-containing protein [Natrialbaceae archaeon A-CW3]
MIDDDPTRRDLLKALGIAGAAAVGSSLASTSATAIGGDHGGGGEPVAYQYFHTPWADIEVDLGRVADAGIDAIWVPQPSLAKLRWEDQHTDDQEGYYAEPHPYYGTLEPHPPLGYQPVDLADFDSEHGTEAQLESMIDSAHAHDIDVILDTVLNHMSTEDGPEGDIELPQFDRDEHFHDYGTLGDDCELDGDRATYECDLLGLPSADIEHGHVQSVHRDYLEKLAATGADGLRYDAAGHVWSWYFQYEINPLADDLGLWRVGEIWDGDLDTVLEFADTGMTVFDFPLYYAIMDAFEDGDMTALARDEGRGVVHHRPEAAVTFVQNHDISGPGVGPDDPEGIEVDLAHAYVLSYEGMPMLFRADLDDPGLQELIWVKRNLASGPAIDRYVDHDLYVFEREGNLLAAINNSTEWRGDWVETSWTDQTLTDYTNTVDDLTTNEHGWVELWVPPQGWAMLAPPGAGNGDDGDDDDDDDSDTGTVPDGTYRLTASHSGKALDVADVSMADGVNVHQWEYVGGDNQHWHLEHLGDGEYRLTASHSGHVLAVAGGGTANGDTVVQETWSGTESQRWTLEDVGGSYRVTNVNSGNVLDVDGISSDDGADVQQWGYAGGDNQHWHLESV